MDLDFEVFTETLTTLGSSAARPRVPAGAASAAFDTRLDVLSSPLTWLGALLIAAALLFLGHTSAEAAGDDSQPARSGLLASVVATTDGDSGLAPVTAPVAGALQQVPAVSTAAPLLPTDARTASQLVDGPLLTAVTSPLGSTVTTVADALPAPVGPVARDVVAGLPAVGPVMLAAAPAPPQRNVVPAASAGATAPPARVERARQALDAAGTSAEPSPPATTGSAAPSQPPSPWSPGHLPPLPAGAPGAGGLAALTAGLSGSALAWAGVLTLLLALVVLARARMAAPLALRSAMHASRMRRPG